MGAQTAVWQGFSLRGGALRAKTTDVKDGLALLCLSTTRKCGPPNSRRYPDSQSKRAASRFEALNHIVGDTENTFALPDDLRVRGQRLFDCVRIAN
jgi:hypothetical protein